MQKRGQIRGLWAVIGAVLALAIIALFTYVLVIFYGLIEVPSAAEQGAINNFDVLGKTIDELLKNPSSFATEPIEFGFPDGYIIVGFDKDWHGDMEDDNWFFGYEHGKIINNKVEANWCSDGEGIQRPTQCFQRACLCLYEETSAGDDFMEEGRDADDVKIPCFVFDGEIVISAVRDSPKPGDYSNTYPNTGAKKYPFPNYGPAGSDYEFLVLYGKCKKAYGISDLYVEKHVDPNTGKIYILIAENSTEIENRENEMKEIFANRLHIQALGLQQNKEYENALEIYQGIINNYQGTRTVDDAKRKIAEIAYQYDIEAYDYLRENNQAKADEMFDKEIETYELAYNLTAISSSLYWYNLAEIYSNRFYTNYDYNKAIEYFKKVIDDPEAESTHVNNAKTNIKGICTIQKPTACVNLDAKYLQ